MLYKSKIKKLLFGTDPTAEYLCTGLEKFTDAFRVFLTTKEPSTVLEVSNSHLFLGYKPMVIAIPIENDHENIKGISMAKEICLSFNQSEFKQDHLRNKFSADRASVARLFLKKIGQKKFGSISVFIFEGERGEHRLLSSFHQFTNHLYQKFKNKGSNNVGLPGNLYEQVRIAYSVPRIISVISLGLNARYNMFPTDLHGVINKGYYVSSLRKTGKACEQVEEIKKIVLSNVSTSYSHDAYLMGKNHMQDLKPIDSFKVSQTNSEMFSNPLPPDTLSYRELELVDTFDVGIHRLLFYKIVNHKILHEGGFTLSHIHMYCEMWRRKNGIKTELVAH